MCIGDEQLATRVDESRFSAEKLILWALNTVIAALLIWNFQRTEETTRQMDVNTAILSRIEAQVLETANNRYTAIDARRDWSTQEREDARQEAAILSLRQELQSIRDKLSDIQRESVKE